MSIYQKTVCIIFFIVLVAWIISNFILAKFTGKKFDNLLALRKLPWPTNLALMAPDSWVRAGSYAIYIILFKNPTSLSSWRYKRFYKKYFDFNFRNYASKQDVTLSKIFLLLALIVAITLLVLFISMIFNVK